jgi:outer membrane protein assembly factor BamE (lipoprotein component of BamABCDE complex)
MMARTLLLVMLVVVTSACTRSHVTVGSVVRPDDAAAIVPGISKARVLDLLGPPDSVEAEPGGSAFEYLYSRTAERTLSVSLEARFTYDEARLKVDRLRVSFDTRGVVRYVGLVPAEVTSEHR